MAGSDNNNNSSNKTDSRNRGTIIVLAVILILGVGGVILALIWPMLSRYTPVTMVKIPTVEVLLMTSEDKGLNISATFSVEVKSNKAKKINGDELSGNIKKILEQLDYREMQNENTMDYVQEQIMLKLPAQVDMSDIEGLYITGFNVGDKWKFGDGTQNEQKNSINNVLQGFK